METIDGKNRDVERMRLANVLPTKRHPCIVLERARNLNEAMSERNEFETQLSVQTYRYFGRVAENLTRQCQRCTPRWRVTCVHQYRAMQSKILVVCVKTV